MHVLIIPSEEFIPSYNKLDGIFQYHQAVIIKEAGNKVGVLSVRLSFSIPMIAKALGYKFFGKKAGNAADNFTVAGLLKMGAEKLLKPQKFLSSETIDGLCIYRVDGLYYRRPGPNKNDYSWVKAGMVCFKAYLKTEGRPDLIHAHDAIYAGLLAHEIYRKYGLRYIITEHSSTYALKKVDDNLIEKIKSAHKNAVGLYAVSNAFASLLNKLFCFHRFNYLPNVLDQHLEKSAKNSKPEIKNNGKFIFLHIAVFKPVKDQDTLLRAFKIIAAQNAETELWIGGTGELEEKLTNTITALGLTRQVNFLGLLSRDEVISRLQQCDCFVLSSKYETFGVVTIEAMLFGKPVIVTRVGIGQDIVNEKNGIIVDVGSVDQLADAMLKLMEMAPTFESEAIRSATIENFGRESFLKRISKVYREAV